MNANAYWNKGGEQAETRFFLIHQAPILTQTDEEKTKKKKRTQEQTEKTDQKIKVSERGTVFQ